MKNEEIAARFSEIADMLDILGEDTFRVLSYQRAARQLESLTENVEDLVRAGRVDQIPGIGPALASNEALARAVRFQPGALRHDVVIPLYDLLREGGGAREEPSGVESAVARRLRKAAARQNHSLLEPSSAT